MLRERSLHPLCGSQTRTPSHTQKDPSEQRDPRLLSPVHLLLLPGLADLMISLCFLVLLFACSMQGSVAEILLPGYSLFELLPFPSGQSVSQVAAAAVWLARHRHLGPLTDRREEAGLGELFSLLVSCLRALEMSGQGIA